MNLIDRHILREWLKILGIVLCATAGLLLIASMYDEFQDLMEWNASGWEMILYFAIKVPSFLAAILPVVLLVSLLYALGQLHRNNEIVAMRAAGMGLFRITRVIWLSGLVLSALVWFLNASMVPRLVESSQAMKERMQFRHEAQIGRGEMVGLRPTVTFDNQRQGRMWFMNRYSKYVQRGYGVTVSELDSKRREKTRLHAREAKFDQEKHCWVFYAGRETWLDPETGEVTRTVPFAEKIMAHFSEDPELMLVFDRKPVDLSFFELERIIDYYRAEDNPKITQYVLRYFSLIADTLAPLFVIVIAIPFAVSGVRVNPAVGVSKSLGLFAVYYLVLKFANTLGARGTMDPLVAALLPSVVMLAVGSWFFARVR